jgi:chemotaxis family two-component system response regulator Rcp1
MVFYNRAKTMNILLVEDNPADIRLTQEVFKGGTIHHTLNIVMDGEEAMKYLKKEGKYAGAETPDLVILDLNIPKKDGKMVLKEIKTDNHLKSIPVIILTTSNDEKDIASSYANHVNCYILKSIDLKAYIKIIKLVEDFWLTTVQLPKKHK